MMAPSTVSPMSGWTYFIRLYRGAGTPCYPRFPAMPSTQELPPLIDRELLFGNPEIAAAQISPDGQYLAFIRPWNDTRNVWVKRTTEPFSAARLLTTATRRPVPGF